MGDRRNRVQQQVYSISVPIDGDRTVVDCFRHRWRHEEMMDEFREIHAWTKPSQATATRMSHPSKIDQHELLRGRADFLTPL
jgi:hypothetical protein